MNTKQLLLCAVILIGGVQGAKADPQADFNRKMADAANVHNIRTEAEYKLFKERLKLSRKSKKLALQNERIYSQWSASDNALFNLERKMHEAGIDSKSYSWNGREFGDTQVTVK